MVFYLKIRKPLLEIKIVCKLCLKTWRKVASNKFIQQMYLGHTVLDEGNIRKQVARKDGDIIRRFQECVPSVCRWIPPPSLMLRHCVHKGDRSLVTEQCCHGFVSVRQLAKQFYLCHDNYIYDCMKKKTIIYTECV